MNFWGLNSARRKRLGSVAVATMLSAFLVLGLIAMVSSSQATYPGENGLIYFTSSRPIVHGYGSEEEIWAMNANGSDPHSLTPEPEPDHGAGLGGFSADGRKIVYTSSRKFGSTSAAGSKLQATAQGDHPGFSLVNQVFVMNADGSGQRQLTFGRAESGCPSFMPNGQQIIFAREDFNRGIWIMNANGTHQRRLSRFPACVSVSPNGRKLAFVSEKTSGGRETYPITVSNLNGSHQHQLTHNLKPDFNPSFSPNGREIAFTGRSPQKDIFVINVNGTHLRQLTHQPRFDECPAFSPDGRKIVYIRKTHTRTRDPQVWVMNANGSTQHRLTQSKMEDFCPQWAPHVH